MSKLALVYVALGLFGWAIACAGDDSSTAPSPADRSPADLGSYGESLIDDGAATSDQ